MLRPGGDEEGVSIFLVRGLMLGVGCGKVRRGVVVEGIMVYSGNYNCHPPISHFMIWGLGRT